MAMPMNKNCSMQLLPHYRKATKVSLWVRSNKQTHQGQILLKMSMQVPEASVTQKKSESVSTTQPSSQTENKAPPQPMKTATVGLNGCSWVDNSDFHNPKSHHKENKAASARASSCGPRSNGNGMRSGIVSLPRIQPIHPAEQREMVKSLHESIVDATPPGSALSIHVSSDMRTPRGGSKFNDDYHSCRNGRAESGSLQAGKRSSLVNVNKHAPPPLPWQHA